MYEKCFHYGYAFVTVPLWKINVLFLWLLLTWEFFYKGEMILSISIPEHYYLEKKCFVIIKVLYKKILYEDVEIWIKIPDENFSWSHVQRCQWRHKDLIYEDFLWSHGDFNWDMDISSWRFFMEIRLKTWRSCNGDFHGVMEILMES